MRNSIHSSVRHGIRFFCGWAFVVLGVLGLFLPLLQGILFISIGALLLAPYVPLFRRIKLSLYWRFPRVRWKVERWKRSVKRWLHREH